MTRVVVFIGTVSGATKGAWMGHIDDYGEYPFNREMPWYYDGRGGGISPKAKNRAMAARASGSRHHAGARALDATIDE